MAHAHALHATAVALLVARSGRACVVLREAVTFTFEVVHSLFRATVLVSDVMVDHIRMAIISRTII